MRQYLKPSAKLLDLDYKCYQNCELCGSTEGTLPQRGAAGWGLESGLGFGSVEGTVWRGEGAAPGGGNGSGVAKVGGGAWVGAVLSLE